MNRPIIPNFEDIDHEVWDHNNHISMSMPVSLREANLKNPLLYDRRYGVFYVGMSHHQQLMLFLQSLSMGFYDYLDIPKSMLREIGVCSRLHVEEELADYYLINTPGTCILSNVARKGAYVAGKRGNLNDFELDCFNPVRYID